MHRYYFALFVALAVNLEHVLNASAQVAQNTVRERDVLALAYRGAKTKPADNPYSIALYNAGTRMAIGNVRCSDWQGNIYVADPVSPEKAVLKRFDRFGKFREQWTLEGALTASKVSVSRSGYIWVGRAEADYAKAGMPILLLKCGTRNPLGACLSAFRAHLKWVERPPGMGRGQGMNRKIYLTDLSEARFRKAGTLSVDR